MRATFFEVCPLCAGGQRRPVVEFPELVFARCTGCGLIYKQEQRRALAHGYEEDYFEKGRSRYLKRWHHRVRKCKRQLLAALEYAPQFRGGAQRVLDIGCSAGYLLEAATQLNLRAAGVDLSQFAVSLCRERGLTAEVGSFDGLPFDDQSFDIVTAKHTLEHVDDPLAALVEVRRVLRPGGVAFLIVPDADYWKRYLMPRKGSYFRPDRAGWQHHVYYGDGQLAALCRRAHLEPVKAGKGIYRSRLARGVGRVWEAVRWFGVASWNLSARVLHLRREIQLIARREEMPR